MHWPWSVCAVGRITRTSVRLVSAMADARVRVPCRQRVARRAVWGERSGRATHLRPCDDFAARQQFSFLDPSFLPWSYSRDVTGRLPPRAAAAGRRARPGPGIDATPAASAIPGGSHPAHRTHVTVTAYSPSPCHSQLHRGGDQPPPRHMFTLVLPAIWFWAGAPSHLRSPSASMRKKRSRSPPLSSRATSK